MEAVPFVAFGLGLLALSTLSPTGTAAAAEAALPGVYGDDRGSPGDAGAPDAADFVVIGGGTAGCVVAARLCEALPQASVALLERGPPRNESQELLVRSPRLAGFALEDPDIAQTIVSDPNPGLGGRTVTQATGATLGGSSSINVGQWTKPPLATFDKEQWAFAGVARVLAIDDISISA